MPELTGNNRVSVDALLAQPTLIRDRIAKLADETLLLPRFLRPYGAPVLGGGMLYASLTAADFFTAGPIEPRTPGAEYRRVEPLAPEHKLALVEDWGASAELVDEAVIRGDKSRMDAITIQLTNDLLLVLDQRTIEALEAASLGSVAVSTSWEDLILSGPLDQLTPSGDRPTAHFAQAQELADIDEMRVTLDTLVVGPSQARQLRTAYAELLAAMLTSAGLKMYVNPRVPDGTAYLAEGGSVGTVGFEVPLTVDVIPDPQHRRRIIQAYAVPAFAIDRPFACKKLVGLS
ncbi:major capsid protein [Mycobacterium paraintracellulare]